MRATARVFLESLELPESDEGVIVNKRSDAQGREKNLSNCFEKWHALSKVLTCIAETAIGKRRHHCHKAPVSRI